MPQEGYDEIHKEGIRAPTYTLPRLEPQKPERHCGAGQEADKVPDRNQAGLLELPRHYSKMHRLGARGRGAGPRGGGKPMTHPKTLRMFEGLYRPPKRLPYLVAYKTERDGKPKLTDMPDLVLTLRQTGQLYDARRVPLGDESHIRELQSQWAAIGKQISDYVADNFLGWDKAE